ncbi:MAG: PQQ-binding-like beta-propeller repeat protein [Acidobacteriota bacterium]|nr:MAG: PQQ-binding-like beta-propeller repeat protein [Acidobacteriota bacterium]
MKRSVTGGLVFAVIFLIGVLMINSAGADSKHWPHWRGPNLNGMANGAAPTEWSDTKNIKWKVAVPGRGFSTPVIWGETIYLTTAVPTGKSAVAAPQENSGGQGRRGGGPGGGEGAGQEHRFIVMALDRKTGKIVWERVATTATPHEGYHRTYGSFASNSPITDGKYLYASFGSRGIYCYDLNGKLIWQKELGVKLRMRLQFGEGSAPLLHDNLLIHTFDQEADSFVLALDKRTGREVWRSARDEASSWSMPYVVDAGGKKQIIISASNKVRAYDPADGKVIWECAGLGTNVIPTPIQFKNSVIVMSGHRNPKLMAIRLGGQNDLTDSDAVLWSHTRGTAYTPSPVLHDNKYYTLSDNGTLSCYNAETGEPYYQQQRLLPPDSFKASPIGADGKLYVASESGVVSVIRMGEKFEVLATNTLEDQMFVSSPVALDGDLYLRSKSHLFCISSSR